MTKRRILRVKETYSRLTLTQLAAKIDQAGSDGEQKTLQVLKDMVGRRHSSSHHMLTPFRLLLVQFEPQYPRTTPQK